jgi:hypothetical protein
MVSPDYEDFPWGIPLCRVREIRKNFVTFCVSRATGDHMCDWHKNMRAQDEREDKGWRWFGVEVTIHQ